MQTQQLHTPNYLLYQTICNALHEDLQSGDITTNATVSEEMIMDGRFVAKSNGVLAGLVVAGMVFDILAEGATVEFRPLVQDGDKVQSGQTLATLTGPARVLLSGERTALNLMQRMSGIATAAHTYIQAMQTAPNCKAKLLDTRKTAPGLRLLDKMAFRIGGGVNHRIGLYDRVMIKNNHIAACGNSITQAVQQVREAYQDRYFIEVEVQTLEQLEETLVLKPDRIMLDNMPIAMMEQAVQRTAGQVALEASGNVTLATIAQVAATGVDYISTGAVTHSVTALDMSLWLSEPKKG